MDVGGLLVSIILGFEGVVVDAVGYLCAPGRVVFLEDFFLSGCVPDELVVFAAFVVDVVGAEGAGVPFYQKLRRSVVVFSDACSVITASSTQRSCATQSRALCWEIR